MTFCFPDAVRGVLNTTFGREELVVLSVDSAVAVKGGCGSTVGMSCPVVERCESTKEPSEFGHMIIIGLLPISVPKPLHERDEP